MKLVLVGKAASGKDYLKNRLQKIDKKTPLRGEND